MGVYGTEAKLELVSPCEREGEGMYTGHLAQLLVYYWLLGKQLPI